MSLFTDKAPKIMADLRRDFAPFSTWDAAAVVGNLGHESGGFKFLQEKKPLVPGSRGGYGWAQWTGPRRRQFEAYCKRQNVKPDSDAANYGFLCLELRGSEKAAIPAVRRAESLEAKVTAFELNFERAGIKHYAGRIKYAKQALAAYQRAALPPPPPDVEDDEAPVPAKPHPKPDAGLAGGVGAGGAVIASQGGAWLWVGLAVVAIAIAGFAAWRYREDLIRICNKLKG